MTAVYGGATHDDTRRRNALRHVVHDTEAYTSSVKGARVDAVQVGRGSGANVVLGVPGERLAVTSSRIGFPISTTSLVDAGSLITSFVHEGDGDSRWCGIPQRPGSSIIYGEHAEHVAVNRPHTWFSFATSRLDDVARLADRLEVPIELPGRGQVGAADPSAATRDLGSALGAYAEAAWEGYRLERPADDVLQAMVGVLAAGGTPAPTGPARALDSRAIVHACIDYAEATDRIPSISEMCLAAHVSERRLRTAFAEMYDIAPTRYFRAWALDEARRRLTAGEPDECTVTEVAVGLGFTHLGRFAGQYRTLYGESPSATLQTPASSTT